MYSSCKRDLAVAVREQHYQSHTVTTTTFSFHLARLLFQNYSS